MPASFTRLLLLLTLLLAAGPGRAQTINTEAATAYWKMTDALRRDEPLTDAMWQQFLALPDNRVYADAVWGNDTASLARYRRAIEVVYRPRYDSVRQAAIEAGKWYYVLVNRYKEQEAPDRAFLAAVVKNPGYLEKMYTYAYEFLPARSRQKVANLYLAYVAFGNDATSQLEGIIFSIRSARESNAVAPAVIHKIDSTIQVLAAGGPVTPLKFYRRLTNGTNGHLPGFFMAYTIYRNGLTKQLLEHADDPIAFALLYQKAAKKDKKRPPIFSNTSERYLRQLARKYTRPRPVSTVAK